MGEVGQWESEGPIGPLAAAVPCADCGKPVDPLRADRVAIENERFLYFCSVGCHQHFTHSAAEDAAGGRRGREPNKPELRGAVATAMEPGTLKHARALAQVGAEPFDDLRPALADEPLRRPSSETLPVRPTSSPSAHDLQTLLLALSALAGLLSLALIAAGPGSIALTARLVVLMVALGALISQVVMGRSDPSESHPLSLLFAPTAATVLAATARILGAEQAGELLTLAAVVVAGAAASVWLVLDGRRPLEAAREEMARTLDGEAKRVVGDQTVQARAEDLRPGEEIIIEPGQVVPVDATLSAGKVTITPWLRAPTQVVREEGQPLVAGAQVISGVARAVVGWAGYDRAFVRLTHDPRRRADLLFSLARAGKLWAERGAPMVAGLAALTAFAANQDVFTLLAIAIAAQAALASPGLAQVPALHVGYTVLNGLTRGITFRTAEALDRAGRVTAVAYCARGTLLLGEPELADLKPLGTLTKDQVLALAAGAESGDTHPAAHALIRAARERGVRPDASRSHQALPGLGVTAIAADGQRVVVGSRALMLKERLSVAKAESLITDLEGMGRTVVLVAHGGRLVGVIGLQDGLRPGARASVQHLLDSGVEPILLSGDARETCEALARTLDIEHVRPEILPAERAEEVQRVSDGGAITAVIGRSPVDDAALTAADVSIGLGSAGSTSSDWSVQLASDDVRDAALAVHSARLLRSNALVALGITLLSGLASILAVAFSLVPAYVAPGAAVLATLFAVQHLKSTLHHAEPV